MVSDSVRFFRKTNHSSGLYSLFVERQSFIMLSYQANLDHLGGWLSDQERHIKPISSANAS